MPNYTDTKVNDMIFNVLDSATYNTLLSNSQLNNNQLYFITNDGETSISTTTESANINLAHGGKYKLTAGGYNTVFTLPSGYTHYTTTATNAAAVKVGKDNLGHVVLGSALTASDVGAATSGHTHTLSLATDTGNSSLTLAYGGKYKLTAGGNTLIFTMPSALTIDAYTKSEIDAKIANVFHYKGNKAATSNLPTSGNATGDVWHITADNSEWAWDGSAWQELGTVGTNHTHSLSIATSTSTSNVVSLAHGGKYQLTAGGQTLVFTMPTDNNTIYTHPSYTEASAAAKKIGRDATGHVIIGDSLTASDVGASPSNHTHTISLATSTSTSNVVSLAAGGKYQLTAGGSNVVFTLPAGYTHPTTTAVTAAAVKVGKDSSGHVVLGSALTASDVGASPSNHTHALSIATDTGTSSITLSHGGKYKLTAGGSTYIFTMPASYSLPVATYNTLGGLKPWFSTTGASTLKSGSTGTNTDNPAVNGRTTTADRYYAIEIDKNGRAFVNVPWENTNVSHTHSLSIATDTGTSQISLAHGGKYKLTAGGSTYIFTMPAATTDTNYYHSSGSWSDLTYTATANGGAPELKFTIPTGTTATTVSPGNHTHSISLATDTGTSTVTLAHGGKYKLTAGGSSIIFTLPSDSNTATAVDNILDGSNSGTAITYAPYTSRQSGLSFYTGDTAPNGTTRLNLNGYFYATKLYSNGTEVALSNHTHPLSIATDTGTSSLTLALGGKYKLTAGGNTYVFTMPSAPATTVSNAWTAGTTAGPKISTTVNGTTGTAVAIPSATESASGVVTTTTQTFKGDKTFLSNTFRIRNENNNNNQAGTNPWITQLNIGDGNYVTMTEYMDDHLMLKGNSILLSTTYYSAYSESSTYSVGSIVWYNKAYYKCTTAIGTAEAWTAEHWSVMPSTAIMANNNINPWTDNVHTLGTSSYRWKNIYAVNFSGEASNITTTADTTNTLYVVGVTSGATTALKRDTSITIKGDTITAGKWGGTTIPVNKGGTGFTTTTYVNAVVIGNASTATETMQTVRTGNGAFYATAQDGKPQFGTLPVGQGGTGKTSWTQWGIVYASASDTLAQVAAGSSSNNGYLLQSNGAAAPGWIQATNANTASTIVKRDSSGNFSAGTITANLTGTATFVGKGSHTAAVTANEFAPPVGTLTIVGNVSNTTMTHTNNANAELVVKAHPTSGSNYYEARLGFSSDGKLYYMPVNTTTWKTVAYTENVAQIIRW